MTEPSKDIALNKAQLDSGSFSRSLATHLAIAEKVAAKNRPIGNRLNEQKRLAKIQQERKAELDAELAGLDAKLAEEDAKRADLDAELAELRAKLRNTCARLETQAEQDTETIRKIYSDFNGPRKKLKTQDKQHVKEAVNAHTIECDHTKYNMLSRSFDPMSPSAPAHSLRKAEQYPY